MEEIVASEVPVAQILNDPRFRGQPITWDVSPEEYATVRHAWLTLVAAEERLFEPYDETVWRQQMATMLNVFSNDRAMELVPSGERWQGNVGAEAFYEAFIPSFEGMQWVPRALVIGPQGCWTS